MTRKLAPENRRNLSWPTIIDIATDIVRSYDDSGRCSLRQLNYRLIARGLIANAKPTYSRLSKLTSEGVRAGTFPRLVDRTRSISQPTYFDSPEDALDALIAQYRLDRTEGQEYAVYVGCEKDALSALLERWLEPWGIPVVIFKGWSSTTYLMDIRDEVADEPRPSVLLYIGDLDPAGEGIEAKIAEHVPFDEIRRIALTHEQAVDMDLPENTDVLCARTAPRRGCCKLHHTPSRIAFEKKYGRLFQIEVDAIDPPVLQAMVMDAVRPFVDETVLQAVLDREAEDRRSLRAVSR